MLLVLQRFWALFLDILPPSRRLEGTRIFGLQALAHCTDNSTHQFSELDGGHHHKLMKKRNNLVRRQRPDCSSASAGPSGAGGNLLNALMQVLEGAVPSRETRGAEVN